MSQQVEFTDWLINRLLYKHGYNESDQIIQSLYKIKDDLKPQPLIVSIGDSELDNILSKYFIDFTWDKSEDTRLGYSDKERISLRNSIKSIIVDVLTYQRTRNINASTNQRNRESEDTVQGSL